MTEMVPVRWPAGLRDRVRAVAGPRGVTAFVVAAVQEKLRRDEGSLAMPEEGVEAAQGRATPWPTPAPGEAGCQDYRPSAANPLRCDCGIPAKGH